MPLLSVAGTANIALCMGTLQIGHWGGPLGPDRLGFKHRPWNM